MFGEQKNQFPRYLFIILMGTIMSSVYATPPKVTLIADPIVLKIPIRDNHENLVDLTKQTAIVYGPSPEIKNNTNYTFLRKSVYEKLKEANAQLPKGMHFCLYEGYRSLHLQKMIFEEQYKNVKSRHFDWPLADIFNETTKLVSPVINQDGSKNIPPHSTGAAIDVYLIDDDGKPLNMGIHPKDWMQDKDGGLSFTNSKIISDEAKTNRQIMSHVLSNVGFVNYPTEYWHWSYGDRYWAFVKKQPFAIYGSIANK
ncbi:MAG: M15 family metallopeptidase [Legionellales bacterium]